jgi:hypothetical protein
MFLCVLLLLQSARLSKSDRITWLYMEEQLLDALRADKGAAWMMSHLLPVVRAGDMAPRAAADIAVAYFLDHQ